MTSPSLASPRLHAPARLPRLVDFFAMIAAAWTAARRAEADYRRLVASGLSRVEISRLVMERHYG